MRHAFFIISIIVLITSCGKRNDVNRLQKLIFASIVPPNVIYDSLNNPNLFLETYIEYNYGENIKIAKGNTDCMFSKNPPSFGLDRFFIMDQGENLEQLIHSTIETVNYDSLYNQNKSESFYVIIYKTEKQTKQIIYNEDCLPPLLDSVKNVFYHIAESKMLIEEKPFLVDSLLIELQKKVFEHLPPPPPLKWEILPDLEPTVEDSVL